MNKIKGIDEKFICNINNKLKNIKDLLDVKFDVNDLYIFGDIVKLREKSKNIDILINIENISKNRDIEFQENLFHSNNSYGRLFCEKLELSLNGKEAESIKKIIVNEMSVNFHIKKTQKNVKKCYTKLNEFIKENESLESTVIPKNTKNRLKQIKLPI